MLYYLVSPSPQNNELLDTANWTIIDAEDAK